MQQLAHKQSQAANFTGRLKFSEFTLPAMIFLLTLTTFTAVADAARRPAVLRGYDPVSYFSATGPRRGKASIAVKHRGAKYLFRSSENAEKFRSDPARFLPQFDGYCAYGMAFGSKSSINPRVWKVVNGKLYLHINRGTLRAWNKKRSHFIKRAENAWKIIRRK